MMKPDDKKLPKGVANKPQVPQKAQAPKSPKGAPPKPQKGGVPQKPQKGVPQKPQGAGVVNIPVAPTGGKLDFKKVESPRDAAKIERAVKNLNEKRTSGRPIASASDSNYFEMIKDGSIAYDSDSKKWVSKVVAGSGNSQQPPPTAPTLYNPLVKGFVNNSYSLRGERFPDSKLPSAKGYVITDSGNMVGAFANRSCNGKNCSLTEADIPKVKPIVEKIKSNGGIPIAYMSLTIEDREDTKGLKKGKDYTTNKMEGWDEFGPKLTEKYMNLMKQRIDLNAKAGFKYTEFDNIDINQDPNVKKQIKATDPQWNNAIKDLVKYANSKGMGVLQKNTVDGWGPEMNNLFVGGVVETDRSTKQTGNNSYNWDQFKTLLDAGKPLIVNHDGSSGCSSMKSNIAKWTGTKNPDLIITSC